MSGIPQSILDAFEATDSHPIVVANQTIEDLLSPIRTTLARKIHDGFVLSEEGVPGAVEFFALVQSPRGHLKLEVWLLPA